MELTALNRRRQRGLTLVELMVAMTISLVVLAVLVAIYASSRSSYRTNENLARVQESARFALDYISRDVRMTGFAGCHSRALTTTDDSLINITASPAVSFTSSGEAISGVSDGGAWTNPTTVARLRGDVITLLHGTGDPIRITADADHTNRSVAIANNNSQIPIVKGDLVMLANCENTMLFRVSNSPSSGAAETTLEYAKSGGNTAPITPPQFAVSARTEAIRFAAASYFIGTNSAGRPALFRANGSVTEELIDNIEDMAVVYGVDESANGDGTPDKFFAASQITNWSQVVSARVSLVVISPEDGVATASATYAIRDKNGDGVLDPITATDRRLRRVFSTTIALRNRVL